MANKYFSMSRTELERDGSAGADAELSRRARGSLKKRGLHSDSKGKITKGSSSRRYVKVKGPARSYPSHSGDPCCSCGHESWSEETRRAGDPCPRCGKDPDIDPKTGKIVGKINVAALGRSVSSARAKILAEALVAQAEAELKKHGTRKKTRNNGYDGNYMSVTSLEALRQHAGKLQEQVGNSTELPDWVEAKITRANSDLLDVYEFVEHGGLQRGRVTRNPRRLGCMWPNDNSRGLLKANPNFGHSMPKKSWDDVILPPYPLAPVEVQLKMESNWSLEYAHQYHSVHVLPNGKFCMLMEDGNEGDGLYVFEYGDWTMRRAVFIDTRKSGWSIRLKKLAGRVAFNPHSYPPLPNVPSEVNYWREWQYEASLHYGRKEDDDPASIDETALVFYPGGDYDPRSSASLDASRLRMALLEASKIKGSAVATCDRLRGTPLKLYGKKFRETGKVQCSVRQGMKMMEVLGVNLCIEF